MRVHLEDNHCGPIQVKVPFPHTGNHCGFEKSIHQARLNDSPHLRKLEWAERSLLRWRFKGPHSSVQSYSHASIFQRSSYSLGGESVTNKIWTSSSTQGPGPSAMPISHVAMDELTGSYGFSLFWPSGRSGISIELGLRSAQCKCGVITMSLVRS